MDTNELLKLLFGVDSPQRSSGNNKVLWSDGSITYSKPKAPSDTLGAFQGKVGTTRRSRKGRTYKAPNGSRTYVGPQSDGGEPTVVAYLVQA